jgi:HK97 family phage portal protein
MLETLVSLMGAENVPPVPARRDTSGLANPEPWLREILTGGVRSDAGIAVNEHTALNYSSVLACVRVLSETLGSMPCITYRAVDQSREKASGHYAYRLLHDEPNPEHTPATFFETQMNQCARWGNSYAWIEWNNAGRPKALWPLNPAHMTVRRVKRRLVYDYQDPDGEMTGKYLAEDILHVRTIGDDMVGWSPIRLARESIGTGMAAAKFGAKLFANGAKIGGILQVPGKLKDKPQFTADFNKAYGSAENAQKTLVVDDGAKFIATSIPPDDAQFLETRKFQRTEIASIYRVPPHMIGDLERATFSNIEHQSLMFLSYTMLPWIKRFEQEITKKLLGGGYFAKFQVLELLRGDMKTRFESYGIGIKDGWLCQNEVRAWEELPPIPGGDVYRMQMQMVPLVGGQEGV